MRVTRLKYKTVMNIKKLKSGGFLSADGVPEMSVVQFFKLDLDLCKFLGDLIQGGTINLIKPNRRDDALKVFMVGPTIEEFERNFPLIKIQPRMDNHGAMIGRPRGVKDSFSIRESRSPG